MADVSRVAETIASFRPSRHSDLYGGVGLACAYAGGVDREGIENLRAAAGRYTSDLAQGAAFGATARQRAVTLAPHTELACEVLCGTSADDAAAVTDTCLPNLSEDENRPAGGELPAYELWRQRIQITDHRPKDRSLTVVVRSANLRFDRGAINDGTTP